jgi:integrase
MKGHIKQRSSGTWTIVLSLGYDPKTGKRSQKWRTVKGTKKDAEKELRRLLKPIDEGRKVVPSKLTVGDYLEQWLAAIEPEVGHKTLVRYHGIIENNVVPHLGDVELQKLDALQVQGFYSALLKSGRKKGSGGLSPQTVRHVHAVLRNALRRAVAWDKLAASPLDRVKPPAAPDDEARVLEPDEQAGLLAAARGTRLFAPVIFSLGTGLRRGELLALKWSDITGNEARIRRAAGQTQGTVSIKAPKSRAGRRTIVLPASVLEALQAHRALVAAERLKAGAAYQDEGYLFPDYLGGLWKPDTFTAAFRRLVRDTGLDGVGHHTLRHTHASALLRSGVDIKTVAQRLGHADVALTLRTYAHVLGGAQDEAAKKADALLREVLG